MTQCKATAACYPVCQLSRILALGGAHSQCIGASENQDSSPCSCVCTFTEADIGKFPACALRPGSHVSVRDEWQACKKRDRRCGRGDDIVVVHGRHLRVA